MTDRPRRKALCVRARANPDAPAFLKAISDEWVHALSLHCDVTVIEEDFDFAETCDEVQPDFVVFDAIHWVRPSRVTVTNADAHPHIPRAFYFNCDPHDPGRPLILEMLAAYRIDTIFCGIEHLQQMPELSRFNCFVIPLFIEEALFRDYGLERSIPVSVFGGHYLGSFYPWRARLAQELPLSIPALLYPHPGYDKSGPDPFAVQGERYARVLAASRFSAADTTRLDYVVRKHLEIPAAGAVLVAPDSDVVKAYGFTDMVNCILGEGPELYAKIKGVEADPALYETIRANGHALIHDNYTRAAWTHIVDWYECRVLCGADEVTQQTVRFGPFRNVAAEPGLSSVARLSFGETPMSAILASASRAIVEDGDLGAAEKDLIEVGSWVGHIAEPRFLLGAIAMLRGDLDKGLAQFVDRPKVAITDQPGPLRYQFGHLDPIELSWLLAIALVSKDPDFCLALVDRAETTPHVAVRRALWMLAGSPTDIDFGAEGLMEPLPGDWPSIHWLGQESFAAWSRMMGRVLAAFDEADHAQILGLVADAFQLSEDAWRDASERQAAC